MVKNEDKKNETDTVIKTKTNKKIQTNIPTIEITEVVASSEQISIIPITELKDFSNHPYHVVRNAAFEELKNSIRVSGILTPILVRPSMDNSLYEIISGHRRKAAAEALNLKTVPAIIRELDDDSAIVIMVDSNQQRENLLPSEKAWAYKMKLDALKRQGKRNDLTSCQVGTRSRSDAEIAQNAADSSRSIHRYICLTNLITPILKLVDDRVLAINTAVELSYLLEEDQLLLHDLLLKENTMPSMAQAARLKEISRSGGLTQPEIQAVMTNHKGESRASNNDMFNRLRPYFPDATSADDMIKQIIACIG